MNGSSCCICIAVAIKNAVGARCCVKATDRGAGVLEKSLEWQQAAVGSRITPKVASELDTDPAGDSRSQSAPSASIQNRTRASTTNEAANARIWKHVCCWESFEQRWPFRLQTNWQQELCHDSWHLAEQSHERAENVSWPGHDHNRPRQS